jgi:hypothetical protein
MATPPVSTSTLSGPQKDAFAYLSSLFASYGLASLAPVIKDYLIQGYSGDTIQLLLPETKEYKERFAANDTRIKNGLAALPPAQYIASENQYRNVLRSYGLPQGFYDDTSDYRKFLESDVSPSELETRVQAAKATVLSDNPTVRDTYNQWYASGLNQGDAIAAVLDPERALPGLQKKVTAAQLGGAASMQHLSLDQSRAEQLANMGVSGDNAVQQFGQVADIQHNAGAIAHRYGLDYQGQQDAENAVFLNDANATQRIKKLGQRETAEFGGRGVGDSRSLGKSNY